MCILVTVACYITIYYSWKQVSIQHIADFYFFSINKRMQKDSILIGSGFDGSYLFGWS